MRHLVMILALVGGLAFWASDASASEGWYGGGIWHHGPSPYRSHHHGHYHDHYDTYHYDVVPHYDHYDVVPHYQHYDYYPRRRYYREYRPYNSFQYRGPRYSFGFGF